MLSSLRILHPPSSDNPTNLPVLILSVDAQRYMFNVPEGTTRSLVQRGARGLSRGLQGVFLPRIGIEECGGVMGLIMSMADASRPSITLHGPPVLNNYLSTARAYAQRENIRVVANEYELYRTPTSSFQDQNISVKFVSVLPEGYKLPKLDKSSHVSTEQRPAKKARRMSSENTSYPPTRLSQKFLRLMFPNSKAGNSDSESIENSRDDALEGNDASLYTKLRERTKAKVSRLEPPPLPPVQDSSNVSGQAPALSFIVQGNPVRGKLDVTKANEYGVPPGKLLGILANGQDVVIERPIDWLKWNTRDKDLWRSKQKRKGKGNSTEDSDLANVKTEQVKILSSDVVGETRDGTIFCQIYLPAPEYLAGFLDASTQTQFTFPDTEPHVIVHAVHPAILQDVRYQAFMKRFPHANHILSNRSFVPDRLAFPSAALATLRMSKLDEHLFQIPEYSLHPEESLSALNLDTLDVSYADLDTDISLQPRGPPKPAYSSAPDLLDTPASDTVQALVQYKTQVGSKSTDLTLDAKQSLWKQYLSVVDSLDKSEMKTEDTDAEKADKGILITTLGTGSALPSKYRNVSGTLLHLPHEQGFVLFDAGEGTYGQLCRKFGKDVDRILRELRVVFLSHLHGDHHMGMTRLLLERRKVKCDDPLYVISNGFTQSYLREVNDIQPLGIVDESHSLNATEGVIFLDSEHLDYQHGVAAGLETLARDVDAAWRSKLRDEARLISARSSARNGDKGDEDEARTNSIVQTLKERRISQREIAKKHILKLQDALQGCRIFTAEVDHRASHCYGIVLRGDSWSVAYSGDTRPCDNFVAAAQDVSVLIHEATFEENEPAMARAKGHSTVSQAVDVAKRMKAQYLIMTHFSQRYPKIPRLSLDPERQSSDLRVGIAFDLMTMRLKDIGKTTAYQEALQVLFEADQDDENDQGVSLTNTNESVRDTASGSLNKSFDKVTRQMSTAATIQDRQSSQSTHAIDKGLPISSGDHPLQRQLIKESDFQYVVMHISPVGAKKEQQRTHPSELAFMNGLHKALEELHGVIGSSFHTDLVLFQPVDSRPSSACAVVKVATPHTQTLVSTVAGGISVESKDGFPCSTHYMGTMGVFDLCTLQAMLDGAFFSAPGRAWLQNIAENSQRK